tara:strand:- start:2870 stop:3469 length:600 start_codon:yes stop_codon:yes gene_type:complete
VKTFPELLEKYPNAAAGLSDQMNAATVAAKTTDAGSGMFSKIAGQLAIPGALAAATYFLTPEEKSVEDFLKNNPTDPKRAAYDEWNALDDKQSKTATDLKLKWYGKRQYTDQQLSTLFGANPPAPRAAGGLMSVVPPNYAGGGNIVGPGTGTSDSIPARLSDGEFVMTSRAVRNAGNGDRNLGAARMYDMMNRFERGVA